jgi:hypothetical protein
MSSQAEIQEKIAAARREADMLKDKIRQRKDQTSDTSREFASRTNKTSHLGSTPEG